MTREVMKHLAISIGCESNNLRGKNKSAIKAPFMTPDSVDIRLYAHGRKNQAPSRGPR